MAQALRIEIQTQDFFKIAPKKIEVEEVPATGRVYFIHQGRIIAVAKQGVENGSI